MDLDDLTKILLRHLSRANRIYCKYRKAWTEEETQEMAKFYALILMEDLRLDGMEELSPANADKLVLAAFAQYYRMKDDFPTPHDLREIIDWMRPVKHAPECAFNPDAGKIANEFWQKWQKRLEAAAGGKKKSRDN